MAYEWPHADGSTVHCAGGPPGCPMCAECRRFAVKWHEEDLGRAMTRAERAEFFQAKTRERQP